MDENEQLQFVYQIFDLPPKTQKEADRNFVWQLLQAGCKPYYILKAYQELFTRDFPDDAYDEDEPYEQYS